MGKTITTNLQTIGFTFHFPGFSSRRLSDPPRSAAPDIRAYANWSAYDADAARIIARGGESARRATLRDGRARPGGRKPPPTPICKSSPTLLAWKRFTRRWKRRSAFTIAPRISKRREPRPDRRSAIPGGAEAAAATAAGAEKQFDKDKLALGRVIGLPNGQEFNLSETAPFSPLTSVDPGAGACRALGATAGLSERAGAGARGRERRQSGARRAVSHRRRHRRLRRRRSRAQNSHGTFTLWLRRKSTCLMAGALAAK